MPEKDLIQKLAQGDPTVRFLSSDRIHSGEMNADDVKSNEYVIALAGAEGARKLSQIALHYQKCSWIAPPEHSTVTSVYCGRGRLELNTFSPKGWRLHQPVGFGIVDESEVDNEDKNEYFAFEFVAQRKS